MSVEQIRSREMMQQELMDIGVWLVEHPRAASKNLKAIRSAKVLEPGVYYNMGVYCSHSGEPIHLTQGERARLYLRSRVG